MVKRWTHEIIDDVDHEMRWEEMVADKMNELYFHPNNNLNVIGGNSLYTIKLYHIISHLPSHLIYIFFRQFISSSTISSPLSTCNLIIVDGGHTYDLAK